MQNQNPSDEKLAQLAQAGCAASFEELVYRFEGRIYRFVANSCRSATDAQEITQDVFVAAHRHLERFDGSRSWATWLFTIARRKCVDFFRSRRPELETIMPERADENDPAKLLAQQEAANDLWQRARAVLSPVQFEALWLRYAEDLEIAEVAQVLRRTRTHVKVLLFRARLRLERELTASQPGGVTQSERAVVQPLRSVCIENQP